MIKDLRLPDTAFCITICYFNKKLVSISVDEWLELVVKFVEDKIDDTPVRSEGEFLTWNLRGQISEHLKGKCHAFGIPKGGKRRCEESRYRHAPFDVL